MNELSHDARRLIASVGDADGPSLERRRAMRERFLTKLGAGVAAGAVSTALSASAKAAGTAGIVTAPLAAPVAVTAGVSVSSVVTGILIGGAVGVSLVVPVAYVQSETRPAPSAASPASTTAKPALAQRALLVRSPVPPASGAERVAVEPRGAPEALEPRSHRPAAVDVPATAPTPSVPMAPSARAHAVTNASASRLAEETELIKSAQRALASGNGSEAMRVVGEYAAKFPRGALREESLALRVLALCLTGSVEQARATASAFVAAAPASPLLPRLENSCVSSLPGIGGGVPAQKAPPKPNE